MEAVVPKRPVMLVSIDGWGIAPHSAGNAISNAKTPVMSQFEAKESETKDRKYLHAQLDASGHSVGLPKGLMGNSEVGHLTMGAGRAQFQDLERINASLEDGGFYKNAVLQAALSRARDGSGRLHLMGLISDGGVHSHIEHVFALLDAAKRAGVPTTYVHFFADGRDTPPCSAPVYLRQLRARVAELGYGSLASVVGRYYAMDRDQRWERIQVAYEMLTGGRGEACAASEVEERVRARHEQKETDEFLKPILVDADGVVKSDDTIIMFDFRSDRMREITDVIAHGPGDKFETDVAPPKNLGVFQMTQYNAAWTLPIIFAPQSMDNVLAEWLSKLKVAQFHTAETEKYAHVTFFFNGGREKPFALEERDLVASPKVATYDLQPEMSAIQVAERVAVALDTGRFPFVMCNFAPPDMVGHTGMYAQTVSAVETTDAAIGIVLEACARNGYVCVITADHGNAEEMLDDKGLPKTSHTTNLVPLNIAWPTADCPFKLARSQGGLADVAPTLLTIMGLPIPTEMTGSSMLVPLDT